MKLSVNKVAFKAFLLTGICLVFNALLWAQNGDNGGSNSSTTTSTSKTSDININTTQPGAAWYTQPWVWIVGAAAFILLLVALLSNARKSEKVVVTKTVVREDDEA